MTFVNESPVLYTDLQFRLNNIPILEFQLPSTLSSVSLFNNFLL